MFYYVTYFYSNILVNKKYHSLFNPIFIIRYLTYLLVEAIIGSSIVNIFFFFFFAGEVFYFYFLNNIFFFKLYITVLDLPNIKMNLPQV